MNENLDVEKKPKEKKKVPILKAVSYVVVFLGGFCIGAVGSTNDTVVPEQTKPSVENTQKDESNVKIDTDSAKTDESVEEEVVKELAPCPIKINTVTPSKNSIGNSEVVVNYTNEGTEAVKLLEFYVCAWDANGYPLKLNFGYDNYMACKIEQPNTPPSNTDKYVWTTYSADNKDVKKYDVVVSKVELYDGTSWVNTNAQAEIEELSTKVNK